MDIERTLARIDLRGAGSPDLDNLGRLMRAHMLAVPLENLDIHLGVPIRLDPVHFYRKIVLAGRGGGCYELNGLFAELLRALGYRVDLLAARVTRPGRVGPEFDHLALRVSLDRGDYLVDVGFGDGIRRPMALRAGATERFGARDFTLVDRGGALNLDITEAGAFDKGYILSLEPRRLDEFEPTRRLHHEDPRSWFVRTRLATIATANGRRTLMNDRYKVTEGDRITETAVAPWQMLALLRRDFGIRLARPPRTKSERPAMRLRAAALRWQHRARKLLGLGG